METDVDATELQLDHPRIEKQAGETAVRSEVSDRTMNGTMSSNARLFLLRVSEQLIHVRLGFDDLSPDRQRNVWITDLMRYKQTHLVVLKRDWANPHIFGTAAIERVEHILENAELWWEELACTAPRSLDEALD